MNLSFMGHPKSGEKLVGSRFMREEIRLFTMFFLGLRPPVDMMCWCSFIWTTSTSFRASMRWDFFQPHPPGWANLFTRVILILQNFFYFLSRSCARCQRRFIGMIFAIGYSMSHSRLRRFISFVITSTCWLIWARIGYLVLPAISTNGSLCITRLISPLEILCSTFIWMIKISLLNRMLVTRTVRNPLTSFA